MHWCRYKAHACPVPGAWHGGGEEACAVSAGFLRNLFNDFQISRHVLRKVRVKLQGVTAHTLLEPWTTVYFHCMQGQTRSAVALEKLDLHNVHRHSTVGVHRSSCIFK